MTWLSTLWGRIGGYDGAADSRARPSAVSRGARQVDEDTQVTKWGRDRLRLECYDLYRNNAVVRGVVERFADNVVGTGIVPQAQTDDDAWNDQAEAFWREWVKVADARQRVPLRILQRQVVSARMLAGESFFLMTDGGQIQPIDADRIVTPHDKTADPTIIDGVKVSATGIIMGYYIANRGQGGVIDPTKTQYQEARNVIHCSSPFRADQIRGIPELAPIITTLADMKQLGHLTIQKAKLDAQNGRLVTTDDGAAKIGKLGPRTAPGSGTASDRGQVYENVGDIQLTYLRPGEKTEGIASVTPNATYVPFIEHLLLLCGSALSMPREMLVLDFRAASFSSNKAAMAQTYRTFVNWHSWECECFLQRLWNWRIAKAINDGQLPAPPTEDRNGVAVSQWYKVEWSQPDYSYLDPEASVDAAIKQYNFGAAGVSSFTRRKGRETKDTFREKVRNMVEAQEAAEWANKRKPGMNLAWTDVIYSMTVGMSPQGSPYAPPGSQTADKASDAPPAPEVTQ